MSYERTDIGTLTAWVKKAHIESLEHLENIDTIDTSTTTTFECKDYIFELSLGARKKFNYD